MIQTDIRLYRYYTQKREHFKDIEVVYSPLLDVKYFYRVYPGLETGNINKKSGKEKDGC